MVLIFHGLKPLVFGFHTIPFITKTVHSKEEPTDYLCLSQPLLLVSLSTYNVNVVWLTHFNSQWHLLQQCFCSLNIMEDHQWPCHPHPHPHLKPLILGWKPHHWSIGSPITYNPGIKNHQIHTHDCLHGWGLKMPFNFAAATNVMTYMIRRAFACNYDVFFWQYVTLML